MAREYVIAYHSYRSAIDPLNDAERGRLFTAMLDYSITGVEPDLRGNERFAWAAIRSQIDRDISNYNAKVDKRRQAASVRWTMQMDASRCKPMQVDANGCNEKEKEKTKTNDKPPKSPVGFEEFWSEYPKKVGKQAALTAFAKAIKNTDIGTMLNAVRAQKTSPQWKKENGQYIPNPATWLNQGRWMDEVQQPKTARQRVGNVADLDRMLQYLGGDE